VRRCPLSQIEEGSQPTENSHSLLRLVVHIILTEVVHGEN